MADQPEKSCEKCAAVLEGEPHRDTWYRTLTFYTDDDGNRQFVNHNYCATCLPDIKQTTDEAFASITPQ